MIIELFAASILTFYTDHSSAGGSVDFYTLKDCQYYISDIDTKHIKGKKEMILDDNLIWTYKTVDHAEVNCVKGTKDVK